MSGRGREIATYAAGYILALLLTAAAFAFVHWPWASWAWTFAGVLILALVQMIVHFRFFLNVSLKRSSRHDLALLLFSALIVTLMVSGTLVLLFNMRMRMM